MTGRDEFDIDARNLVRIDAGSAGELLNVLTRLHAAGKKLRIIGLSTLVAAYLEVLGFANVAGLRTRAV
jgi:anti-anti-sigma regulatory factor